MAHPRQSRSQSSDGEEKVHFNWPLAIKTTVLELAFLAGLVFVWWALAGHRTKTPSGSPPELAQAASASRPLGPDLVRPLVSANTDNGAPQQERLPASHPSRATPEHHGFSLTSTTEVRLLSPRAEMLPATSTGTTRRANGISSKEKQAPCLPSGQAAPALRTHTQAVQETAVTPKKVRTTDDLKPAPKPPNGPSHPPEYFLADMLRNISRELALDDVEGTSKGLLDEVIGPADKTGSRTVLDLIPNRSDLSGLPIQKGSLCQTSPAAARQIETIARHLRLTLFTARGELQRVTFNSQASAAYFEKRLLITDKASYVTEAIHTLTQVLSGREQAERLLLVRLVERINGPEATKALAQQAVFDLSAVVRDEAVDALRKRPANEVRELLLKRLRYPWPPIADNAADALVSLRDKAAIARLVDLLDDPDPAAPVLAENKKWVVPELVCVNHLRNCLLCHAPSSSSADPLRGPIPDPRQPIPDVPYYSSQRLSGDLVRADITYLRQDFSVSQPVPDHGVWPENQRFDYFIRMRELSPRELADRAADGRSPHSLQGSSGYPQREAVLFALRELTATDQGSSSDKWRLWLRRQKLASALSSCR